MTEDLAACFDDRHEDGRRVRSKERAMIAEVKLACGRQYLSVAGIAVAMEGDKCRSSEIPEAYLPPIPPEELEHATIGDKRAKDMPIEMVRWFRGDNWTPKMMEYVANKINAAVESQR